MRRSPPQSRVSARREIVKAGANIMPTARYARINEAKTIYAETASFNARSLRDRKFGTWAAQTLGFIGAEANLYAEELVKSSCKHFDDDIAIEQVARDFRSARIGRADEEIRTMMQRFSNPDAQGQNEHMTMIYG